MINNKGFTLIELISVIGILALLMILMIPTINNISQSSNEELRKARITTVLSNAEAYAEDYINDYQKCNSFTINTDPDNFHIEPDNINTDANHPCTEGFNELLEKLSSEGYMEKEEDGVVDPRTSKPFDGTIALCYDKDKISIKAHYVEPKGTYSCP